MQHMPRVCCHVLKCCSVLACVAVSYRGYGGRQFLDFCRVEVSGKRKKEKNKLPVTHHTPRVGRVVVCCSVLQCVTVWCVWHTTHQECLAYGKGHAQSRVESV